MAIDPCTTTAPVKGVVRFVLAEFLAVYPEFTLVPEAQLQARFDLATLLLNNSCGSLVCDANVRQTLLYALTAHIAALFDGVNGVPPSNVVGRVASATEGSVSASFDFGQVSQNAAWYEQTKYGAMFWAMTARWRSFRYVPPPATCGDLLGPSDLPLLGPGCGC